MWICGQSTKGGACPPIFRGKLVKYPLYIGPGAFVNRWITGGDNLGMLGRGKSLEFCQIRLSLYFGGGTEIGPIYCGLGLKRVEDGEKMNLKIFKVIPN